jgi:formate hydrogenlyase subunit 3/multisubunit Na+/H+ antiporter MnhD subunit
MVTAFIFFAHLFFALYIFTKKWQNDNLKSAFLNIVLIGILFSVGWTITTMVSQIFMEPEGFGIQFNRDTFSLNILSIVEYFFYKIYYKEEPTEDGMEKQ